MKKITGYVLMVAGFIFLLVQLGYIENFEVLFNLIKTYWPMGLLVLGYYLVSINKNDRKTKR